ncbi:unnamed protein product [Hymenolepis diminuta]|uniref:Protein kinase domain-containing protein n=1 Tax=Hymenolepis diminuta TaxID=6216 RepID=A0A0R3SL07_HYMDI|nr:unnamed protein product [Hymenolepis diminuta]
MNGKVLARDALGLNIVKTRRRLLMFGPVLRWKVLSRKSAGGKLPEAFVMPVFLYGWSTTVYRKMDDNKLRNVENTARQMTLSLHSERQMSVQVLAEKFPEKCRRRMRALACQKSEYLESLLLENFQDEWEVDPNDLTYNVVDTLGQGSFGLVCRGRLFRLTTPAAEYLHPTPTSTSGDSAGNSAALTSDRPPSTISTTVTNKRNWLGALLSKSLRWGSGGSGGAQGMSVAVKILSPGSTYDDVREFLGEASHMKQFNCNHIVRLLGIVSKQVLIRRQPIVVMELMEHGDLATYLRHRMAQDYSQGSVAPEFAIKWAAEIADGMAYLEYKGFVHRDLAARNCLVGVGLTVKIGGTFCSVAVICICSPECKVELKEMK